MNIWLTQLKLKNIKEQDVLDYCQINNINPLEITELWLSHNNLTDISGIRLFKNLEYLDISNNEITDISAIKNLKKLQTLNIERLKLKSDQVQYINSCKKLEELYCYRGFEDINDLFKLNDSIENIDPFEENDEEEEEWNWREKGSIKNWGTGLT